MNGLSRFILGGEVTRPAPVRDGLIGRFQDIATVHVEVLQAVPSTTVHPEVSKGLRLPPPFPLRYRRVCVDSLFSVVAMHAGGCPAASNFLLLRQRKVSKRKATRLSGSLRFAPGNLQCSTKAGSGTNSASPQTSACPDPLLSALLGPARMGGIEIGRAKQYRQGHALACPCPSPTLFFSSPTPSGCAEERRAGRKRASDCLSEASLSSTLAGPSTAGCPERSGGTQAAGAPFLCLLSFGEAKESELPPGNPRHGRKSTLPRGSRSQPRINPC